MQETLLRMWLLAKDHERVLRGENASLKFACRVARNVALEEIRRFGLPQPGDLDPPEGVVEPRMSDPFLRDAIRACVARLPRKPHRALVARVGGAHRSDKAAAAAVGMSANTFLQNIVRARKLLRPCLERKGVRLAEILPMKKERPEIMIEQACSAFRDRDRWGRILPSPAFLDLAPEARAQLFQLQLETRELERALNPAGRSGTVRAVLQRM
jgi:DNA-directed RNA polymerase specialized sigma24 family protein